MCRGDKMTILPVLSRELTRMSRRGTEHWSRLLFGAGLMVCVLGTFAAWYYWEGQNVSNHLMARIAERSFFLAVALHILVIFDVLQQSARCIAEEKDRRTLEFLLATRLSAGEIIMGKFVARWPASPRRWPRDCRSCCC